MDTSITATSIMDNSDTTYSIFTGDVKYATTVVKINGVKILDVIDHNTCYEIKMDGEVTEPLNLSAPEYFHGTLIATNTKIQGKMQDRFDRTVFPLAYFPEVNSNIVYYNSTDLREMSADIRLIFAVPFQDGWDSDKIKNTCITPMIRMSELLENAIDASYNINLTSGYAIDPYSKLGDIDKGKSIQGVVANMINAKCSGIVVDFSIDVYPSFRCTCSCDSPTAQQITAFLVDSDGNTLVDSEQNNLISN